MHTRRLGLRAAQGIFAGAMAFATIGCGSTPGGTGNPGTVQLDSAAKIDGFLDGKKLVMAGADIPTDPNGYPSNVNFAQATQCYHEVDMLLAGENFSVKSQLGTLKNAPNAGDVGQCDASSVSNMLEFDSTTYLIENVEGDADCFDFGITFTGFGQEGRGSISADKKTLELELFFKSKATGIRCADGKPGSGGITLDGKPFTGDAVQIYRINE